MKSLWKDWEEVISALSTSNQSELAKALQDTRFYLNGLTDGWHEFYHAADQTIKDYSEQLSDHQLGQLKATLDVVRKMIGLND